jgi:hypothetical protein
VKVLFPRGFVLGKNFRLISCDQKFFEQTFDGNPRTETGCEKNAALTANNHFSFTLFKRRKKSSIFEPTLQPTTELLLRRYYSFLLLL